MAIAKAVPFDLPEVPFETPQRAYFNQVTGSETERQQAINQALQYIYQIDPRVPLGQMLTVTVGNSSSDPITTGTDLTNHVQIRLPQGYALRLVVANGILGTAPVGSSAIFDLLRSIDSVSWSSIFASETGSKIVIPDGSYLGASPGFAVDPYWLYDGDLLRFDILQVGSSVAGAKATAQLTGVILPHSI